MKKFSINKVAAFIAAVAAPVLTGCVDQHWLSAVQATDIGVIIATAFGFLHVNNDQAAAALAAVGAVNAPPAPKVNAFGDNL